MPERTTTLSLYNLYGCLHTVALNEWASALRLAEQHGWDPAGTGSPPISVDIDSAVEPVERWKGAYDVPAGQMVHAIDARALAAALSDVAETTPTSKGSEDKFRQELETLSKFCCTGSFIICADATGSSEEMSARQVIPEGTSIRP